MEEGDGVTAAGRHLAELLAVERQLAAPRGVELVEPQGEEQDAAEVEAQQGASSSNSVDRGQERPQDAPGIDRGGVDMVRGWVGLVQQTVTVGARGRVPVFGGFMSAGRYSRGG